MARRKHRRGTAWLAALMAGFAAAPVGCTPDAERLPPLGEALVAIDTDAPVPRLAGRLRIDVHASDGTWLDSRDLPTHNADEYPGSFSVFLEEGTPPRDVLVRLRAYPEGRVRDYRGERWAPKAAPGNPTDLAPAPPPGDTTPRLVHGDRDVTPPTEPLPELTVDRLLRVHLAFGERGRVDVVLRALCVGTMADLAGERTCIDAENELVAVETAVPSADTTVPAEPFHGAAWPGEETCNVPLRPAGALFEEEICVPGGAFLLGDPSIVLGVASNEVPSGDVTARFNAVPERVAVIPPLRADRYEVTVGRWRQALARGFVPPDLTPIANEGALATTLEGVPTTKLCTWSATPRDREAFPVNCVSWASARAFCQYHGGDLPTEARWEHVVAGTGLGEATYPWGDATPSCDRAVIARTDGRSALFGFGECLALGFGVGPVDAAPLDVSDLGLVGLGGNVSEWVLDSYLSYASLCWATQPLSDPTCIYDAATHRSHRGAGWVGTLLASRTAERHGSPIDDIDPNTGLRCIGPGIAAE